MHIRNLDLILDISPFSFVLKHFSLFQDYAIIIHRTYTKLLISSPFCYLIKKSYNRRLKRVKCNKNEIALISNSEIAPPFFCTQCINAFLGLEQHKCKEHSKPCPPFLMQCIIPYCYHICS